MSSSVPAAAITLMPAIACAAAFVALHRVARPIPPGLPVLLAVAFAVRAFFILLFPDPGGAVSFDAESYRIVGALVRSGKDVYAATGRHPYLPFQMYVIGLSSWLAAHTDLNFFSWVRLPNVLADLAIVALIYRAVLRLGHGESEAFWLAMIWALHPVSIFTSTIHGQFDSVTLAFSLTAWYVLRFSPGQRGAAIGGIALGFAILDKTWPAIFIAPLLVLVPGLRGRLWFLACMAFVPLVAVGVYGMTFGTSWHEIDTRVIQYNAVPDQYGFTYALRHYLAASPHVVALLFQRGGRDIFLASLTIVTLLVVPRRDALTSCVALLATFLVFAPGWGAQYLLWIVPFAILARQRAMLAAYSIVATAELLVYYWGVCGYACPGLLSNHVEFWQFQLLWPLAMLWLARETLPAVAAAFGARRFSGGAPAGMGDEVADDGRLQAA